MSWQLASFLILAAVLVGGFAWYERSRPPAQVVALVAALAALAIAGRIAFAAFPNVKPTTDIVVFAGFALGAAPGFAVGALAALVSNFWFGQGPWTPWQMAGWGMCGILGAAVGLGWRNAGRLTLAAVCGLAGIAYGALLNFSLMATYGGELSPERFGALTVQAVPFEVAHVAGNVTLALLAGPAMVRMLVRFRERFEWRRGSGGTGPEPSTGSGIVPRLGGTAAALLLVAAVLALLPAPASASAVSRAGDWLVSVQNGDGGWGASPDDESGTETTCWAMLGLAAAGHNPLDVSRGGHNPVQFLRAHNEEISSPGDLARTILALRATGLDPRQFAGRNLVNELVDRRRDNGSWEGWPGSTAFAVIALREVGTTGGLKKSLDWLHKVQNDDGGWGDVPGSPSTADGTGAVMQALAPDSKAVHHGITFLRQAQRPGGGFPLGGNGFINTQSTAWAIQGILAAGGSPASYRRGGDSAYDYLAKQQEEDGSFRYSGSSDQTPVWVTGQVVIAASAKYFPLAAPAREPKPKPKTRSTAKKQDVPPGPGATTSPTVPGLGSEAPPPGSDGGDAGAGSAGAGAGGGIAPSTGADTDEGAGGSATPAPLPIPGTAVPPASTAVPEEEAPPTATDNALVSESSDPGSERSPAGAVFLGLVAGGLLFAAAWGARRGWMHWRYGL